ncbi:cytochrome P450 [Dothidotthia symphoricarpi CBS 119687]|uniref:Cytochrome P450 n=1 Tax=Dothidotthia symphoricarpi CBS 119687 TaxID=1392245 RepID=A0A6A5ZZL9_9PLEO|nr:cytochrome P450 [Dothidotthia symphoricarpi CBS 119687]KAF2124333.1 cytochrome P450 [Dothidotthia symphoricarpi CBS 119687]
MGILKGLNNVDLSRYSNWHLAGLTIIGLSLLFTIHCIVSAVYHIFLSPLRNVPGPKLWIAFPSLQHIVFLRGDLDKALLQLHNKYGHVVRIGPREVSFNNAQAWQEIYGHGQNFAKANFFEEPEGLPDHLISANQADHSRYRKAMSNAFSEKSLRLQEPLIKVHVDLFLKRLRDLSALGEKVDMVKWLHLVTFDLIGDLAFGEPFGCLEKSDEGSFVRDMFYFIKAGAYLKVIQDYALLKRLLWFLTPKHLVEARAAQLHLAHTVSMKRMNNSEQQGRGDFMDSMVERRNKPGGLTDLEIMVNSNILISAGAETSATTISASIFYLLKNPTVLAKVQQEVRSAFQNAEEINFITSTARLPYMIASITEAMRMFPPLPGTLPRLTPDNKMTTLSGYDIPPNVIVGVNQWSANRDERNFHRANEFIPERWLKEINKDPTSPFYHDQRDVAQPFSVGPRNCIGRNLAYTETRTILALLLFEFDIELCTESQNWQDQKTWFWWDKHKMWLRICSRNG